MKRMKYHVWLLLAGWIALACPAMAQAPVNAPWHTLPPGSYAPNQVQFRLSPQYFLQHPMGDLPATGIGLLGIPALDSLVQAMGLTHLQKVVTVPMPPSKTGTQPANTPVLRWVKATLPHPKLLPAVLDALCRLQPWVDMAEPIYTIVHHEDENSWTPNDSLFARQWHYHNTGQTGGTPGADIKLPAAWHIEKGKPNVIVAIMDNGLDTTHPDLRPNLWAGRGYNFFTNQPQLNPGNHGNHVGGTIGAVSNNTSYVAGVAGGDGTAGSGVRLMSCQIFGPVTGAGGVENAFVWSANNGAAISHNSWGFNQPGVFNQSVLDAIDFFIDNGGGGVMQRGLVIFSGGNLNQYAQYWPGVYHRVIGITATNHRDRKAWYSTFHENLDLAAPGGEVNLQAGGAVVEGGRQGILSTITVANGAYGYNQGTSMAAPHVSGVAALVASLMPGRWSADDIKSMLLLRADDINANLEAGFLNRMGTGRLNAQRVLQLADSFSATPVVAPPTNFRAQIACNAVQLDWQKNAANDDVVVAVSTDLNRGGLFGIPAGTVSIGQVLQGGARVIYRGSASTFTLSNLSADSAYFFKIWSVSASQQYSLGVVLPRFMQVPSPVANLTGTVVCFASTQLSWAASGGCPMPEVVLAYSPTGSFDTPAANAQPGDAAGNGTVLYRGTGNAFTHTLPAQADTVSQHYRLWPVLPGGGYGQALNLTRNTPAALRSAAIGSTTTQSMEVAWLRNTTCFANGEVIVGVSEQQQWGTPLPAQQVGDAISGGGTLLYRGTAASFVHNNLPPNSRRFYAVWPVVNGTIGRPVFTVGSTSCAAGVQGLPFRTAIEPDILGSCGFDTLGFRNFTAGPLPTLSIVSEGFIPEARPFAGNYMLRFNSFETRETNEVWLTSPQLSSEGIASVDVRYAWYEDGSDYVGPFFMQERVSLEWSTDRINWQPVVAYTRIPAFGGDGWKQKQVTLPPGAGNQPSLFVRWIFRSAWGYDCYLDEIEVIPTKHRVANNNFNRAIAQFTLPTGLTHYYDQDGHLLLSMHDGGQSLGHIEENLLVGLGGQAFPALLPTTGNYVRNPGGWLSHGTYYATRGWAGRNTPVTIRHYLAPNTFSNLQQAGSTLLNPPLQQVDSHAVMHWYVPTLYEPQANPTGGHSGVPIANAYNGPGYWQMDKGTQADTLHYTTLQAPGLWKAAEIQVMREGTGGIGIGSTQGNGALAPHFVQISGSRVNNQSEIRWTTGYERGWLTLEIERRGPQQASFVPVGTVAARGWPQAGGNYTFTDTESFLPNGIYTYRVKAITRQGQEILSPEVSIEVINVRGVVIYPNPAEGNTLTIFSEAPLQEVRIVDMLGRVMLRQSATGTQQRIDVSRLMPGVYFLQTTMGTEKITRKFLLKR